MDSSIDDRNRSGRRRGGIGMYWQSRAAAGALVLCLVGCSGSSYEQTTVFDRLYPDDVQTGVFKAGNVAGLEFDSGARSGVTDGDGSFACVTGQQISFSLGNVVLGDTVCTTIAHPVLFTSTGSLMDATAINMMRFLMLLDGDQIYENGIFIPQSLRGLADAWPAIDFSAMDFEAQLTRVLSDIASVRAGASVAVPTAGEAFVFLDASLSCAYSGVFANSFASGPFASPTEAALAVYRDSSSNSDRFVIQIKRNHPQSFLFVRADGTVELMARPSLINGPSTAIGSVQGIYVQADIVGGRWSDAVAQQTIDRVGSFEVIRIGRDQGQYRFVGTYSAPLKTSVPDLAGFVVLALDGDTVRGEVFDLDQGVPGRVSGRRLPASDSIELSVASAQATSVVTLLLDQNGAPSGLQGMWPGVANSTLDVAACRLN